jgi:sulfite reductase (NADPH) hemoprotein beta-component
VIPARTNADPFSSVLRSAQKGQIISVTTHSKALLLGIPHLYKLSSFPIVIHTLLSGSDEISNVAALRHTGLAILHSASIQEAQDLALISHALALSSGRGVIHFWENDQNDIPIPIESNGVIESMLAFAEQSPRSSATLQRPEDLSLRNGEGNIQSTSQHTSNEMNRTHTKSNGISSSVDGDYARHTPISSPEEDAGGIDDIFRQFESIGGRKYSAFEYFGAASAADVLVAWNSFSCTMRSVLSSLTTPSALKDIGIVSVRLYRPWSVMSLLKSFPPTIKRIASVEMACSLLKWGPLFIDVLSAFQQSHPVEFQITSCQLSHNAADSSTMCSTLEKIVSNMRAKAPQQVITIGQSVITGVENRLVQPQVEIAYIKILRQLFGGRLNILNSDPSDVISTDELRLAPEYSLGAFFARIEKRLGLLADISSATRGRNLAPPVLNDLLTRWLSEKEINAVSEDLAHTVIEELAHSNQPTCRALRSDPWFIKGEVPWIIGSEAWAYDLGSSAVHHALASGKNINLLVIDSEPYSLKSAQTSEHRKKDIGLYAMNFGNAYVASVAIYSSYTQVMHAMLEAQQFDGPSIVLAYLPCFTDLETPLQIMQDTKLAVDSGYWPLYRWTPSLSPNVPPSFQLDSERVKKDLKAFIDRENHLTHLTRDEVQLSPGVFHSYGAEVRSLRKRKALEAMDKLLEGLSGPPITILFASDGGNAESVAKRLARRGKARGLKPKLLAMDDFPIEDLSLENYVIFCTSTAGQGEFPQNGREMWDALKSGTDIDLAKVRFSVFGLGDSHYWPRKEDKIYYNKPAKDLDARLAELGGIRMAEIGLGDDQDPDSYDTGYNVWEPLVWKSLGVDQVDADAEEPKPLTNEDIKLASNFLRGTIAEGLVDSSTGAISESDAQLTKFHGTYMQDDRDLREERKGQGLEPAYSFMVRVRMSGGVCQPHQWIAMDEISDKWGNETFKLVQCFWCFWPNS